MSPLARSVLALAALLAAADSQYDCANTTGGVITEVSYKFNSPFYVPYGVYGQVHIPRAFKDIKQQHPLERLQYAAAGEQSLVESLQRTLPAAAAAAMSALSALARSLIALAALLAVAESGDYDCVTKIIGRTKKHSRSIKSYSPFYVAHPGHRIDTPRIERIPFLDQVGQNVTACNNKPGHRPPTIKASRPDQFSSVDIDPCEDPYGCIVYVTQYFEYPSNT